MCYLKYGIKSFKTVPIHLRLKIENKIKLTSWNTTAQKPLEQKHKKEKYQQHTGNEQKSVLHKSKAQGS